MFFVIIFTSAATVFLRYVKYASSDKEIMRNF